MGVGHRFFLFLEDNSIRRISWIQLERLWTEDAPVYAGRTIRRADVVLETRNRRPQRIIRIIGSWLRFDGRGSVRDWLQKSCDAAIHRLDTPGILRSGNLVDMADPLRQAREDRQFLWRPSPADISRITQLIWKPARKPPPSTRPRLRRVK